MSCLMRMGQRPTPQSNLDSVRVQGLGDQQWTPGLFLYKFWTHATIAAGAEQRSGRAAAASKGLSRDTLRDRPFYLHCGASLVGYVQF